MNVVHHPRVNDIADIEILWSAHQEPIAHIVSLRYEPLAGKCERYWNCYLSARNTDISYESARPFCDYSRFHKLLQNNELTVIVGPI